MLSLVNGLDFGLNFSTDSRSFFLRPQSSPSTRAGCSGSGAPPKKNKRKKRTAIIRPSTPPEKTIRSPFSHDIKPEKNRFCSY